MKKLFTVLGARPQFVKAAMVSKEIRKTNNLTEFITHTGQHYDHNMSGLFFDELGIPEPDVNLNIGSGNHGAQTGEMLKQIEKHLLIEKPDMVIVYGDTNSTLAGALAASKLHIPIAHVEAGLRSFNKRMPEEVNRVLTDHISSLLFSPTNVGKDNLLKEGIDGNNIFVVGDVMYDAIKFYQPLSIEKTTILKDLRLDGKPFVLATVHRAENTNSKDRLIAIFNELLETAEVCPVVMPIHPRTSSLLQTYGVNVPDHGNLKLIPPVGYLDMCALLKACRLMITDSGGVQKEAFLSGKFCITVREETEWVELVDAGFNYLAKPVQSLHQLAKKLLDTTFSANGFTPYGDGRTAERIIKLIEERLYR